MKDAPQHAAAKCGQLNNAKTALSTAVMGVRRV
jgi:hypothetical protein